MRKFYKFICILGILLVASFSGIHFAYAATSGTCPGCNNHYSRGTPVVVAPDFHETVVDSICYKSAEDSGKISTYTFINEHSSISGECGDCEKYFSVTINSLGNNQHSISFECTTHGTSNTVACSDVASSVKMIWSTGVVFSIQEGTPDGLCDYCGGTVYPDVTISWNIDGTVSTTTQIVGNALTLPTTPTKTGYTFAGWFTQSSGGTQVTESTVVSSTDTTYYAQWTANEYPITFYVDGEVYDTRTQTYGQNRDFPTDPTKAGYTFKGWFAPGTTTPKYSTTGTWKTTSVAELEAQWTANTYTITWYNGDGTTQTTSQTYGANLNLPADATRTGYTFDGWFKSEIGNDQVTSSTVYNTAGSSSYYAHHTANQYPIKFYVDGTLYDTRTQTYGQERDFPTNPTKTGYTFKGWYVSETSTTQYLSTGTWKTTTVTVLNARWTANTYTTTWMVDGEVYEVLTQTYNSTYLYPSVNPSKPGYTFYGWLNPSGQKVTATKWNLTTDRVNTAKFTPNEYTITWNDGQGNTSTSTQTYDAALDLPETEPSKTGYTFAGWFTEASGGTQVTASSLYQTADACTYYAQYTANTYTSTWIVDGVVYDTIPQTYKAKLIYPTAPSKPGYTFKGWYTASSGGSKWTGTIVGFTKDVTVYAQWTPNTYTITWDVDGSTTTSTQVFDTVLSLPESPSKENYHFAGWWTEEEGGDQVTAETIYTTASNTTYYAQWFQVFSVTVPATLPLVVNENGQSYSSDVVILNNSSGDIKITAVTVNSCSDWVIVPYSTNMANEKVDSNCVGFKINDLSTTQTGTTETLALPAPWTVPKQGTLPLEYDARVSASSKAFTNECILEIVFVVKWASE